MRTADLTASLATLFSELADGAKDGGNAFILNSGDAGLLRSIDRLSAAEASASVNEGATIAAHARHVSYGLSLMNRWMRGRKSFRRRRVGRSYHLGAIRQIDKGSRGPKEGTFL